jgi:hypothetical protein
LKIHLSALHSCFVANTARFSRQNSTTQNTKHKHTFLNKGTSNDDDTTKQFSF